MEGIGGSLYVGPAKAGAKAAFLARALRALKRRDAKSYENRQLIFFQLVFFQLIFLTMVVSSILPLGRRTNILSSRKRTGTGAPGPNSPGR